MYGFFPFLFEKNISIICKRHSIKCIWSLPGGPRSNRGTESGLARKIEETALICSGFKFLLDSQLKSKKNQ